MSICLGRLKSNMQKVRLVDAAFIWTEPHSKRIKLNLTIQKEVFSKAIFQNSFVVEFVVMNQVNNYSTSFVVLKYCISLLDV
jgi:nonsense-mediated mRNA decay protein 3